MASALKYTSFCADPDEAHRKMLALMPPGARVLEVGAATGYLSEVIRDAGFTVMAVEVDSAAAAIARSRRIDVCVSRLEELVVPETYGTFDCLLLGDVLEHVADADSFLSAGLRYLRRTGCVVLSVPNVAHWSLRWSLLNGRFEYTRTGLLDDTHVRFYTAASLERILRALGLTVTERHVSLGLNTYRRFRSPQLGWYQRRLVRVLSRCFPTLFGFQFIWKAEFA